jgi:cysteine synthase A
MKGAIERAIELVETDSRRLDAAAVRESRQYRRPCPHHRARDPRAISRTRRSMRSITGVGTGGHITGCAEELKRHWPALKVYAVEPTLSPVISGGQPGPHPDPGHRRRLHPRQSPHPPARRRDQGRRGRCKGDARRSAREEGMLVGISSGATLAAIEQKLGELPPGSRVLGFNYDTGERYLSVPDFLPEI